MISRFSGISSSRSNISSPSHERPSRPIFHSMKNIPFWLAEEAASASLAQLLTKHAS